MFLLRSLDSIIQHYRKRKCTKCGSAPEDPAVCLVCGKFTCLQGKCCSDALGGTPNYECIQVRQMITLVQVCDSRIMI